MKTKFFSLTFISLVFIFNSCTIVKRQHLPGYYLSSNSTKEKQIKTEINYPNKNITYDLSIKNQQNLKTENVPEIFDVLNNNVNFLASSDNNIAINTITSKSLNQVKKAKINKITNIVLKEIEIKPIDNTEATNLSKDNEGKSQLVALLLCIFVGSLGIHRFYLGYTEIGIIQLLTAGGCGIWALIDLIRIAMGDLKPKNGDYAKKL